MQAARARDRGNPVTQKTGSRYERELINLFDEAGYAALRVPASGSATTRPLPDLHVGNGEQQLAIEAKYSSADHVYIDPEKIAGLRWFAAQYDSVPLVAGRWSQDTTWYFQSIDDLYETPGKRFRISRENQQESATTLDELLIPTPGTAPKLVTDGGLTLRQQESVKKQVLDECERLLDRNVGGETVATVARLRKGGFHPSKPDTIGASGAAISNALDDIIADDLAAERGFEITADRDRKPIRYHISRVVNSEENHE